MFDRTKQELNRLKKKAAKESARNVQGSRLAGSLWFGWLLFLLVVALYGCFGSLWGNAEGQGISWLFFRVFSMSELLKSVLFSACVGFLGTAMYYQNQKWKDEKNQLLAMIPGKKGTQYLLHNIPMWLDYSEVEKMEWLNRIVEQAWPYYDKAICDEIKRQVEPMLQEYTPPFIKKISFKKFTFGDSPFRVEGIQVNDQTDGTQEKVEIDVLFRWSGDASIFLAIELLAGGVATRMVPKVTDLAVSGQARVMLSPLIPDIPGFGAMTVALMRPPRVKFHLDFGKAFGGSLSAKAVKAWLDPFLRETLSSMLVWPRRIVVPILPEEVTGPLTDLYMKHQGALEVMVKSGKNIPKMDVIGSSDPLLSLFVDHNGNIEETSTCSNTLSPVWNEKKWLLVQEPQDQHVHLVLYDVDSINLMEIFKLNVLKGATSVLDAREVIGRAKIPINTLLEQPGKLVSVDVELGLEEFNNPSGCGIGRGLISLELTYWPLDVITGHADEPIGALLVTLIAAKNMPIADTVLGTSDVYVTFTCGKVTKKSTTVYGECSPSWTDCKFEWYKIRQHATLLKVEIYDYDRLSKDDLLATLDVPVKDIAHAPMGDVTKTYEVHVLPSLTHARPDPDAPSQITLRIQWVPFKRLYEKKTQ